MKKSLGILLVVVMILLLNSCVTRTSYEPKTDYESLIIGRLVVNCKGFNTAVSIDGEHFYGAEVFYVDNNTGKERSTKTVGPSGIFTIGNLTLGHTYSITGVVYTVNTANYGAKLTLGVNTFPITAEAGKVLIWGDFYLDATYLGGSSVSLDFTSVDDYKGVQDAFIKTYSESDWISKPFKFKTLILPAIENKEE